MHDLNNDDDNKNTQVPAITLNRTKPMFWELGVPLFSHSSKLNKLVNKIMVSNSLVL